MNDIFDELFEDEIHRSEKDQANYFERVFNVSSNPFPPSGIASASARSSPLSDNVSREIARFVINGYKTDRRQFMTIKGDYGTGKTHTLRFIEHFVNDPESKLKRIPRDVTNGSSGFGLAVYVERPRLEAHELNRTILKTLGLDTVRKYIWYVIRERLKWHIDSGKNSEAFVELENKLMGLKTSKTPQKFTEELFSPDTKKQMLRINEVFLDKNIADHRYFFAALEAGGWRREVVTAFLTSCLLEVMDSDRTTELSRLFVGLLLAVDEASFNSWETLLGITKPKSLKTLGAPEFLEFLLKLLELNGIVYVYLLIDEFEEVSQGSLLTSRQRQDYLYTLREVLNKIQNGLSIIIAISPPGWDAVRMAGTPLTDVSATNISLESVDLEAFERLVRSCFVDSRVKTSSANYKLGDEISPLNIEILAHILEKFPQTVQKTPRNLLQLLHELLNRMEEYDLTSLTDEFVDDLIVRFAQMKSGGQIRGKGRR